GRNAPRRAWGRRGEHRPLLRRPPPSGHCQPTKRVLLSVPLFVVPLTRRLLAEFLGSALLAAVVIGSGLTAQQLSPHATGLELLENAIATGAGLFALILMFGPVSDAHFNPVVSLVDAAFGGLALREAVSCLAVQVL